MSRLDPPSMGDGRRSATGGQRALPALLAFVAVTAACVAWAGGDGPHASPGDATAPRGAAAQRPPSGPPSRGRTLFDAAFGARGFEEYDSVHNPGRGRVVDDPVLGAARRVVRIRSDDRARDGRNVRVQFASPGIVRPNGQDVWIGTAYLFPRSFPDRTAPRYRGLEFANLGDVHGPPFRGTPMIQLSPLAPGDGRTRLGWPRTRPYSDWGWIGPYVDQVRGRWVDVVFHIRYSTRRDGFVELWMDTGSGYVKQRLKGGVTRLYGITCGPGDAGGRNYHKIAHYWPRGMWGRRGVTSYFAAHRIGTTFAAVAPGSYRARGATRAG